MKTLSPKKELKAGYLKPKSAERMAQNYGDNYMGMGGKMRPMKMNHSADAVMAKGSGPYPKEYMDGSKSYAPGVAKSAKRVMKKMGY